MGAPSFGVPIQIFIPNIYEALISLLEEENIVHVVTMTLSAIPIECIAYRQVGEYMV